MKSKQLEKLTVEIWNWCFQRKLFISAKFIQGIEIIYADSLSRKYSDSTEWMLKSEMFERICNQCFMPDIDLFALRLNKQLNKFVSWNNDPEAYQDDAFLVFW